MPPCRTCRATSTAGDSTTLSERERGTRARVKSLAIKLDQVRPLNTFNTNFEITMNIKKLDLAIDYDGISLSLLFILRLLRPRGVRDLATGLAGRRRSAAARERLREGASEARAVLGRLVL